MAKVAIITGGASGMGLAVATALSQRDDEKWHIHMLDINAAKGEEAASSMRSTTFHTVEMTDYKILSTTFDKIFKLENRLDFVFANAGLVGRTSFYDRNDDIEGPPPELDQTVIDVNLKSVINTSYLAQHYFRLNKEKVDAVLVMTASSSGIYPVNSLPVYSASKFGVVGLARSLSRTLPKDSIRVNALCPGPVATNILGPNVIESIIPKHHFTPIETVARIVLMLVDNKGATDAKGVTVEAGQMNGLAVELCVDNFYFKEAPEYSDALSKEMHHDATVDRRRDE